MPGSPDNKVELPPLLYEQARAKVNLTLHILGKRPDGYHEIESLLVAVDLHDSLTFTDDLSGEISLTCNEPTLPVGGENLVVMAAERLRASAGSLRGVAQRALRGANADVGLRLVPRPGLLADKSCPAGAVLCRRFNFGCDGAWCYVLASTGI